MKKRLGEEEIIRILKEREAGLPVKDLIRKHGISEQTYYRWKSKFGGMEVNEAKRLKALEVDYAVTEHDLNMTRACGLMKIGRSSYYYQASPRNDSALREALRTLAAMHRRWGY